MPLALAAGVNMRWPAVDVGDGDELAGGDGDAVEGQRAGAWQWW